MKSTSFIYKTAQVSMLAAGLALAACSDKAKGIDSDGNCKYETVNAFNDINFKAQMFNIGHDTSDLQGVQNSCAELQSLIGGSSCQAKDLTSGAPLTISTSTVATTCSQANDLLNPKPAPPADVETEKKSELPTTPELPETNDGAADATGIAPNTTTTGNGLSSTPKEAMDSAGYCTEEFSGAALSLANQIIESGDQMLKAIDAIKGSPTEEKRTSLSKTIIAEGHKIEDSCDRFERTWGEVSCLGTDGKQLKSQDLKSSCDNIRAFLREGSI